MKTKKIDNEEIWKQAAMLLAGQLSYFMPEEHPEAIVDLAYIDAKNILSKND